MTIVWKFSSASEPSLRDLRLVRRVGRCTSRILEDVPLDDRGRERVVVSVAQIRAEDPVLRRDGAHRGQRLVLAASAVDRERTTERIPAGTVASMSSSSDA
jgi:hypothetical protein